MANYCKCGQEEPILLALQLSTETNIKKILMSKSFHTCRKSLGKPIEKPVLKTRQKRYSGFSQYQKDNDGFNNSGHS